MIRFKSMPLVPFLILWVGIVQGAERKPGWETEWQNTLAAAKKEGQVSLYIYHNAAHIVAEKFRAAYPEIKVQMFQGRGGMIAQRIVAERRAGKYLADISLEGFNSNYLILHRKVKAFDPIKPALILPEVADESLWWEGKHHYLDEEGQYVFRVVGAPQLGSLFYNTKLVDAKEIKSFWDIAKPKWKGKIEARDARIPGPGNGALRFFYHNPELGPAFLRRLFGEMDIMLFHDFRQGTDWLARGKFAICFACADISEAKRRGLPVDEFGMMKEGAGLVSLASTLGLLNRPPHPHAAKLFINWFLSREGQIAFLKSSVEFGGDAQDSLRIDIPKDDVPPLDRRQPGVNYLDLDVGERLDMAPIIKVVNEALAGAQK